MNRLKQDWKSTLKTVGTYSFQLAVIIEVILVILDKSEFLYPFEGWTFRITFLLCFIKFLCAECTSEYTIRDNIGIAVLFWERYPIMPPEGMKYSELFCS